MSIDFNSSRRRFLGTAVMSLAAAQLGMAGCANAQDSGISKLSSEGRFPSLSGATQWLNSAPLTAQGLAGKVVVVNFWTFSCINSIRALPYVRAWYEKYADQGLVVIGDQAPEFEFEKTIANVRWAVKHMSIKYPVAIDNNLAIWRAFNNDYWPAFYFIDAKGQIRHHQFGEGDYDKAEEVIQQLLADAGVRGIGAELASVGATGLEAPADWDDLNSPESYLGFEKAVNFKSPGGEAQHERRVYSAPATLDLNSWALSGDWTAGQESVVSNTPNGWIRYRFHARDINLILGPSAPRTSVRFRVFLDGQTPGAAHGVDVDGQGYGTVKHQRLYQLIRQPKPILDRELAIEFLDPGAEAFDFTFG